MAQGDKCAQSQAPPERFSAYVVIPSPVFFDKRISERARLMYGLLSCMSNHKGYCWAKNETIGRYFGVDERTVRRHLKELLDHGHIEIQQKNDGGTTVRQIRVAAVSDRPDKSVHPPGQICPDRPDKSVHQNNNNINNIPPIVPLEGDAPATAPAKKQRRRKPPTGTVELPPDLEESFSRFWDAYPSKKDKQNARFRWLQLSPEEALVVSILDSIRILKTTEDWEQGIIPMPSTFLNNRRWEDAEGVEEIGGAGKGMRML